MRSYRQFCPAARALDLIGERWTLLIVRELLRGPKRYTDLQAGLPGIGPTLLAGRLRDLEAAGVLERASMPAPAASTVYRLTPLGEELRPLMAELYRFGMGLLEAPAAGEAFRASWLLGALEAAADAGLLPDAIAESYEFRIGEEVVTVDVGDGRVQVTEGAAREPAVVVRCAEQTLLGLGTGRLTVSAAVADGALVADGDRAAAARCAALFGLLAGERPSNPAREVLDVA